MFAYVCIMVQFVLAQSYFYIHRAFSAYSGGFFFQIFLTDITYVYRKCFRLTNSSQSLIYTVF